MFKRILKDDQRNGKVISALFPFKHEFYRKAGYEVVTFMNEYTFTPSVLSDYRFDGEVCKWSNGDPVEDFLKVYQTFASRYNMALMRDEDCMQYHLKTDKPYIDRKFSYLFKQKGKPIAYLIFTDIRHDPAAILKVEECAWTGRDGFYAILGFLARFEADYGEIKLPLPKGIDLLRVIRSTQSYDINKHTCQHFMVRVINARKLLEQVVKPADCDLKIRVIDDIIEENNRTYRVKADQVAECKAKKADLELNVRALGQMAIGAVNFDEAMLRRDVTLFSNEEMLRSVFAEKNIWCGEHF
jgi:predicted acetyltransferase